MKLLEISDLTIHYITREGAVEAVNGINLDLEKGETLGLVGETGAGKTTTALGILRLVPDPPGKIIRGKILFEGEDVMEMNDSQLRAMRGGKISMIFQDPMTALNPVMRVIDQIAEIVSLHRGETGAKVAKRALEMLEMVGIPAERASDYPHQFSGGMKQRVVIAMALACNPQLLLADEPTTALDVTIQAQVLDMMSDLQKKLGTAMILITHDLGVVAETCDKVAIMYAGEIVECGTLEQVFDHVSHPYTEGLFASLPRLDKNVQRLKPISGMTPDPTHLPTGCKFHPRCEKATDCCAQQAPPVIEVEPGHAVRCHHCSMAGGKK